MKKTALRAIVYALSTGALIVMVQVATLARGWILGGSASRGVSVGISLEWVVFIHLLIGLAMALIPRTLVKVGGIAIFVAAALYLLLPQHPVRALFMAVSGAGLAALAMLVCARTLEHTPGPRDCTARGA